MQGVDLIITITDRDRCEDFTAWFRRQGIPLVLTALGQGTATTEILDCLGLEDSEKAVLFCVAPRSPKLVRRAARELWLDVPGNGVLMAVPVDSIGGRTAKEYLLHQQEGENRRNDRTGGFGGHGKTLALTFIIGLFDDTLDDESVDHELRSAFCRR